jgi:hypothetical protein
MLEVYERNMRHWSSIKKPTPQAFFENLLPYTADGHVRQALVLTWMMLPRAGGRDFKDVRRIVTDIFQRNLAAWDEDHRTFTGAKPKKAPTKRTAAKAVTKPAPRKKPAAPKKPVGRKAAPKRAKSR